MSCCLSRAYWQRCRCSKKRFPCRAALPVPSGAPGAGGCTHTQPSTSPFGCSNPPLQHISWSGLCTVLRCSRIFKSRTQKGLFPVLLWQSRSSASLGYLEACKAAQSPIIKAAIKNKKSSLHCLSLDASFAGEAAPPTTYSHPPADSRGGELLTCFVKLGTDITKLGSHPSGSNFFSVKIILSECKQTPLALFERGEQT